MPRPQRKARYQAHRSSPYSSPKSSITPTRINAQLSAKAEGKRLTDSDDSDGLVTKGNGGRRGAFLRTQEVFASGAVALKDKTNAHPTRAQRRKQMQDAMRSASKPSKSPTPKTSNPPSTAPSPKPAVPTILHASQSVDLQPISRPTPMREESILNGIRPRKRQNSILQSPGLGDSTIGDSTLGSLLLPQDENSPLNLPRQKSVGDTPASVLPSSSSKKRKLGPDDVPATPAESSLLVRSSPPQSLPVASLPPQPSTKKSRKSTEHDETDIMAPPMSSSSEQSSPPKPLVQESKKRAKPAPVALTTQDLQKQLMPTKRKKQTRTRTEFDIPSDTDSAPQIEEDDSTFLGSNKRKSTRRATANTVRKVQPKQRKVSDKKQQKPRSKQNSTAPPPLLASSRSRSTRCAVRPDQLSDSVAKSPSQLSSVSVASPPQRPRTTKGPAGVRVQSAKGSQQPQSRGSRANKAQGGGSPLKTSFGSDIADNDKENSNRGGGMAEEDDIEVQVGRAASRELEDDPLSLPPLKQPKGNSKWAAIDDFEMDFEDVSLPSESSDPMAR